MRKLYFKLNFTKFLFIHTWITVALKKLHFKGIVKLFGFSTQTQRYQVMYVGQRLAYHFHFYMLVWNCCVCDRSSVDVWPRSQRCQLSAAWPLHITWYCQLHIWMCMECICLFLVCNDIICYIIWQWRFMRLLQLL